jgi:methyltransferase (TIGR00027 family)
MTICQKVGIMEEKIKSNSVPSRMAEGIAMQRFAETSKDKKERICYDPFAIHFIRPEIIEFGKNNPEEAKILVEQMEQLLPGLSSSIIARVRYFDDYLKTCLKKGIKQLVILGAGYDTRAYRIEELKNKIEIYEVDHPITQKFKIKVIEKLFGSNKGFVKHTPIDFQIQKLNDQLPKYGYRSDAKTLFIMEGLSMYIPQSAIEDTLSFISKNSKKGSFVIFDFYPESLVNGTNSESIATNIRTYLIKQGEPLKFGIEEENIEKFLINRGFTNVTIVNSSQYKNMYFHGKNIERKVCSLLYFVHAEVR